ncbi:MAG: FAD-binding oxidoreductase [Proteobacteria bacterium]|nr:FAD-binding oxidoreductase [Pseudomonadota bacterium]
MSVSTLSDATRLTPYWWDATPRPSIALSALPARADVVVVGSGYTGLVAALQTARGGRSTVVLDAEDAGYGCSTRNGGQISTSIKGSYSQLSRRHGAEKAAAILRTGHASLAWTGAFIEQEGIDCDFSVCGRFHAAHSPRAYEALVRSLDDHAPGLKAPAEIMPRSEQRAELGTDAYHGGVVFTRHASVDPAKYHQGVLDRAIAAGAQVVPHCPALALDRDGGGWRVRTPRGDILARNVVVGTNGYTGKLVPWLRRRVIPIGSYIIATEALPPDLMARVMPRRRIVSDTRKVVYYYRPSPDNTRIVFGGRVSFSETDPRASGPLLRAELVRLFPELASVRISHSWWGYVAYTFDELAHIGERDGVYYAMGYCGSGVGMAGYLGMCLGQRALGSKEAATGLDPIPFQTRPLYTGNPWFLAPSVAYYRWKDNRT